MNDSQPLSESTHIELPDVWDQLDEIVKAGESEAAINFLNALPPGEEARILAQLSIDEQQAFLNLLDGEHAPARAIGPEDAGYDPGQ